MSGTQSSRGTGRGGRNRGRSKGGYGNNGGFVGRNNNFEGGSQDHEQYQRSNQSAIRNRGRGSSKDHGSREYSARSIGYQLLKIKSTVSPREAVLFCNEESFIKLLLDPTIAPDWIDHMLKLINNAVQADDSLHGYRQALKTILLDQATPFLCLTCTRRFSVELESNKEKSDSLLNALQNYLGIFYHLCTMDPFVSKSLIGQIKIVKQLLKAATTDNEAFQGIYGLYAQATAEADNLEKEKEEMEKRKKEMMRTGRMVTNNRPAGDFREISVYPTEEDLTDVAKLRANRVSQAFESVDDYLDIQFRLLREDFVSTIRQGIQEFRKNPQLKGPNRFRSGDIKIYENFHILAPNFGRDGISYIVQIDLSSRIFQRINWDFTKRLMYGSLLCLSQDQFDKNNLFAVITEMNKKVISKDGCFEIQFLPDSQMAFDLLPHQGDPFMAIESTTYFEAYKHVLKGMQKLGEFNFAFANHIVRAETEVMAPEYTRFIETGYIFITADNQVTKQLSIFGDYGGQWPSAEKLGFNESQYEAYIMALTKKFVVIQGPPGTGKTFIGLKIVETLLYNLYHVPYAELDETTATSAQKKHSLASGKGDQSQRARFCPPARLNQMLIVCFTNHALDQFLEGMLNFCPIENMVRVGSQSHNELLAQCNLRNKKRRLTGQQGVSFFQLRMQKLNFAEEKSIGELNREMELTRKNIVHHENGGFFVDYPEFYYQLLDLADELEEQKKDPNDAMSIWLGCGIGMSHGTQQLFQPEALIAQLNSEKVTQESIEIEGEAERELQNRQVDLGHENMFITSKPTSLLYQQEAKSEKEQRNDERMDNDGFITVTKKRKNKRVLSKKILDLINNGEVMPEADVKELHNEVARGKCDITKDLLVADRWRLYRYLLTQHQGLIAQRMRALQKKYRELVERTENLRMQEEIDILRSTKVIGMTTTAAARLQSVLQQVGPEIIVVEEAAEVLEAHIITALSKKCQHLILIGDHKQLKPNPTVYELAKNYHLDLSLFERMVNNGLPVRTLNIQHRMRPEISKYVGGHIYDRLDDHSSVQGRDPIEGVKSPVFFFNHNNPETSDEGTMSHSNQFEAQMVVGLTRYLLRQKSYKPEDITIITMYTGQLLEMKRMMPKNDFRGVKITSVDNFQGEENKIIIISLVRSNPKGALGFVKIENRVCVSLSRAQYGMYVFGDFDMLAKGSKLWRNMVDEAKMANEFGSQLHLSCQQHNNPAVIEQPVDFDNKVPIGGCQLPCKARLDCGHICKMLCHSCDLKHEFYKCTEPCPKLLTPCKHSCPAMCHQECPMCDITISKTLPCGHIENLACHLLYQEGCTVPCRENCQETLPCGHLCTKKCSQPCTTKCMALVEQICSRCGEVDQVPCYKAAERLRISATGALKSDYQCDTPCEKILDCGHKCTGTCYKCNGDGHQRCVERCGKILKCGHLCVALCMDCTEKKACGNCNKKCQLICSHGSKCTKRCFEDCLFTMNTDDLSCKWGCQHSKCERDCGEPCSFLPCEKSCDKMVECKQCKKMYPCVGLCGDTCPLLCPHCDLAKKMGLCKQQLDLDDGTITAATRCILLEDCNHVVPEKLINDLVYSVDPHTLVKCPYKDCKKWLLNTPRFASRTRIQKAVSHQSVVPQRMVVRTTQQKRETSAGERTKQLKSNTFVGQLKGLNPGIAEVPQADFLMRLTQNSIPMPELSPTPPKETAKERRRKRRRNPPPPLPGWLAN